jgi:IPT/TIG domain
VVVKVGTGTVTGSATFSPTAVVGVPTLSGFQPAVVASGSTLVISGTNFVSSPAGNRVRINQTWATVATATPTALTVVVPDGTSSGKVTVATATGTVVSSTDLIVAPPGVLANHVLAAGRTTINGSSTPLSLGAYGPVQLLLFDVPASGPPGTLLSLATIVGSTAGTSVTVYGPNNAPVQPASPIVTGQLGLALPAFNAPGTYTVAVTPGSTGGTFGLAVTGPVTGSLIPNAAPTTVSLTVPGQASTTTFTGTAGSTVSLTIAAVTLPGGTVTVYNPDGSVLLSAPIVASGVSLQPRLPQSGPYPVVVQPPGTAIGSFTLALSTEPAAILTINQPASTLVVSDQVAHVLPFDAAAGTVLAVGIIGSAPSGWTTTITVLAPDGAIAGSSTLTSYCADAPTCSLFQGSSVINLGPLALGGRYSLVIQQPSYSSGTGSLSITLSAPFTAGALTPNTTASVRPPLAGQGISATFTAQAGDYGALVVGGSGFISTNGVNGTASLTVIAPDGKTLTRAPIGSFNPINLGPLPLTV